MAFELFIGLVAVLAVAYAFLAKYIQNKFIDKKQMEDYQAKMKLLSQDYEKAKKTGDNKKMQTALDKQMAFMPEMNKIMFAQFKPMIYIIVVFAILSWAIGWLDDTAKDDILLNLKDDGIGCDKFAGDGIYSICHQLTNDNSGKWTATAIVYESDHELARNQSYFQYDKDNNDSYVEAGRGEDVLVTTNKLMYSKGENTEIYVIPANITKPGLLNSPREISVGRVDVVLSNGTYFKVDLPFTIPILEWKAFYQPIVWFIFVSFILNIVISLVMGKKKTGEKK
ncbi:MAG: EMC3/TMCO1 family protein [Candidatus Micrarchaeota archaeon]